MQDAYGRIALDLASQTRSYRTCLCLEELWRSGRNAAYRTTKMAS